MNRIGRRTLIAMGVILIAALVFGGLRHTTPASLRDAAIFRDATH
jgi:hypothetical protein